MRWMLVSLYTRHFIGGMEAFERGANIRLNEEQNSSYVRTPAGASAPLSLPFWASPWPTPAQAVVIVVILISFLNDRHCFVSSSSRVDEVHGWRMVRFVFFHA